MVNTSPATDTLGHTTDDQNPPEFTTSSVLVTFLHLIDDIIKLLPSSIQINLQFEKLMASDIHGIKLLWTMNKTS